MSPFCLKSRNLNWRNLSQHFSRDFDITLFCFLFKFKTQREAEKGDLRQIIENWIGFSPNTLI